MRGTRVDFLYIALIWGGGLKGIPEVSMRDLPLSVKKQTLAGPSPFMWPVLDLKK